MNLTVPVHFRLKFRRKKFYKAKSCVLKFEGRHLDAFGLTVPKFGETGADERPVILLSRSDQKTTQLLNATYEMVLKLIEAQYRKSKLIKDTWACSK